MASVTVLARHKMEPKPRPEISKSRQEQAYGIGKMSADQGIYTCCCLGRGIGPYPPISPLGKVNPKRIARGHSTILGLRGIRIRRVGQD